MHFNTLYSWCVLKFQEDRFNIKWVRSKNRSSKVMKRTIHQISGSVTWKSSISLFLTSLSTYYLSRCSLIFYWTANDHSLKVEDIFIQDLRSFRFYFFVCPSVCMSVYLSVCLSTSVRHSFDHTNFPTHIYLMTGNIFLKILELFKLW